MEYLLCVEHFKFRVWFFFLMILQEEKLLILDILWKFASYKYNWQVYEGNVGRMGFKTRDSVPIDSVLFDQCLRD